MSSPRPSAPAAAPRPRLTRRKKLVFTGVALAIGLLLCEGGLRVLGFPKGLIKSTKKLWASEGERVLGPFRPDVTVTIGWPPELKYTVHTNSLGLRGPVPSDDLPVVLCVGDSTTFGSHVAEDETYPRLLSAELERLGIKADVVNAGCPRWTITDENEFLADALPRLKPSCVVLLFCGNDLVELNKEPARERALASRSFWSDLRGKLAVPEAVLTLSLNLRRTYLKARGKWPRPMRADQGRTGAWARDFWARYSKHLGWTRAMCQEQGSRLIIAPFPGYLEVQDPSCEIEQTLPDIARTASAEYVNLYPPFRASPEGRFLLPHDAHASSSGNELIAREIAARIKSGWTRTDAE